MICSVQMAIDQAPSASPMRKSAVPNNYATRTSDSGYTYPLREADATLRVCRELERAVLERLSPALLRISVALDESVSAAQQVREAERASLALPSDSASLAEVAGITS